MIRLNVHEARILGVLVEKAQTTPAQYPMTLNALVSGANQKSNRHPVLALTDEQVMDALDGIRAKGLAREVMLSGSRVEKHRHVARDVLEVSTSELVVLTELLLRGPQTVGEIRSRASRMHPLESTEVVTNILDHLASRDEPLVVRLDPLPGSRATRFAQLLCPEAQATERAGAAQAAATSAADGAADPSVLEERVATLEREVASLRSIVADLATDRPVVPG